MNSLLKTFYPTDLAKCVSFSKCLWFEDFLTSLSALSLYCGF